MKSELLKIIAASIIGPVTNLSLIIIKLTIRLITYKHTISVYLLYLLISSTLVHRRMGSDFEPFGCQISWKCTRLGIILWSTLRESMVELATLVIWADWIGHCLSLRSCGVKWIWDWISWLITKHDGHGCVSARLHVTIIERKVVLIFSVQPIVLLIGVNTFASWKREKVYWFSLKWGS